MKTGDRPLPYGRHGSAGLTYLYEKYIKVGCVTLTLMARLWSIQSHLVKITVPNRQVCVIEGYPVTEIAHDVPAIFISPPY